MEQLLLFLCQLFLNALNWERRWEDSQLEKEMGKLLRDSNTAPFEYPTSFIENKILVLTTTNGTKLLHMALDRGAPEIITGSFPNLSAVCEHLIASDKDVLLGCAAWKDRVNLEDTLFAGAVIHRIKSHFNILCDSCGIAESMYLEAGQDRFSFMKAKNATHYHRLMKYGLEKDIRYCLTEDGANVLPIFKGDRLVIS
jgi:2-phosphosulfolactate phosphatase